jgi:hypothetical protein
MIRFAFLHGEREKRRAGSTGPDLKVRNTVLIDFGGKKEFSRVITHKPLVPEPHNGQPVIEAFKGRFLPFPSEHMPKDEDRLALTLDPKILQRALGGGGTSKLTGGAGSNPRHTEPSCKNLIDQDLITD